MNWRGPVRVEGLDQSSPVATVPYMGVKVLSPVG